MKYFLCLVVLVGCSSNNVVQPLGVGGLKYKVGNVVQTKLGETGIIISIWENAERPYFIDIYGSSQNVSYEERFIVKVIEE